MHAYQGIKSVVRQAGPVLAALLALCAPPAAASAQTDIVLSPSAAAVRVGNWQETADSTAVGGRLVVHPNANAPKRWRALASPTDYFELTFEAVAGVPYRLWLHGRAEQDYWGNDSVFVQFSGTVTDTGAPTYRTGTTSAVWVNLEECSGCAVRGWTWQDNGYGRGTLGPLLYFATTGPQRLRVQTREDGMAIDQILLSPSTYLNVPPTEPLAPPVPVAAVPVVAALPRPVVAPVPVVVAAPVVASALLKVLHWNIHHGLGTDNVYNIDRLVHWIAASGANVVSLNEVEKFVGGYGYEDQPGRFASLLAAKTGRRWYHHFAHRSGGTNGQGNLLLSTFPFEDTDTFELSYSRSVARIQILVNGIRVNVFSTHLDAEYSGRRLQQVRELTAWASSVAEQRIHAGDYNASATSTELVEMAKTHSDTWAEARRAGTAVSYADNPYGNTRNSRIDYVWSSKSASRLTLKAVQVYDTRDARGVMPSDHRPIMSTFEVK